MFLKLFFCVYFLESFLSAGACFGRLVGHLLHAFDRRRGTFADSGTFALIGAAAGLGGMARMTISLVVILLEATGDIQYLVPLMLTVMLARWVGNCFNDGLYDIHIHLRRLPILEESDPDHGLVDISVGDVMTPAPICFPPLVSAYEVFDMLQRNRHHAFPVVGKARSKGQKQKKEKKEQEQAQGDDVLLGMVPRKVTCDTGVELVRCDFTFLCVHVLGDLRAAPTSGFRLLRPKTYHVRSFFCWFVAQPFTHSLSHSPTRRTEVPLSPLVNWGALERQYPDYPDIEDVKLTASDAMVRRQKCHLSR